MTATVLVVSAVVLVPLAHRFIRKILAPIKIKSAFPPTPPPPKTQNYPPPKTRNFLDMVFPAGPRIADKKFTDTRIFLTEIAAIFEICDCNAHRGPQESLAISETLHCDLRVRWKVAGDLRFRVAISEAETPCFCGISDALAPSTRKSLAIAFRGAQNCENRSHVLKIGVFRVNRFARIPPIRVANCRAI